MRKLNVIVFALLMAANLFAQGPDLNFPDDKDLADEARRKFAVSVDEMSIKRYPQAVKALNWLLNNTPKLYDGLYINGYRAYEELAEAAGEKSPQYETYLDSMLIYFKKKKEAFELSDREKNNLAFRYYKYFKTDKERIAAGMEAYHVAYENIPEVINNNIVSYMDMARRYRAYGNDMSTEDVLEVYGKALEVIDLKIAEGEDADKMERYRAAVNGLLTQTIGDELNCEFINKNLAPQLDQKQDVKLAKKVFSLLLEQSCSDSPYFEKAAEIIQTEEPNAGFAKVLAQRAFSRKEFDKAAQYYDQAIELETDQEKQALLYMDKAKLAQSQGKKAEARSMALKAAQMDSELNSDAYTFIGNLYMGSFNDCKQEKSQIDDRAIYMAAYDAYQKAGNSKGMADAKAQFPTVSDVFTANKNENDPIKVGCWINVTTTIRTRPSN